MASLYKVGENYYANYVNATGARVRGSLHTKSEQVAEQALAIIINEVDRERLTGSATFVAPSTTLNDFSTDYIRWYESEYPDSYFRTEGILRNHILPFFGEHNLNDISPLLAEQYKIARKKKGVAPSTVKKELDALKAAINRAVKWELIPTNRVAGVASPKLLKSHAVRFYSADELQAIYDNSTNYASLWKFAANTGMRRNEILKARRKDIVDGAIRIESAESDRTKSGKWRLVPLSPGALVALEGLPRDYLAPRIHINSLGRAFIQDAKRAKVGGSLHQLRHTFCSVLVMAGVDLRTVQELAGHSSYETTLQYAHLSQTHLKSAVLNLTI